MSPSALFVTTVPVTLEVFLAPFARYFREQGWRIDALANGAATEARLVDAYDARFDVTWSRNPLSPGNVIGAAGRVRHVVAEGRYDLVHVHTPIASFVTRYALRSLRPPSKPIVIYTAHGFHFYEGRPGLSNAAFRTLEKRAGAWTDYLVTINDEDFAAARRFGTIAPGRVRLIPGIGVDTALFSADAVSRDRAEETRRSLNVPTDACVVTMVAELAPVKRHHFVLEAMARVTDPRVVLVLVGEGPLESALREKVVAHRLTERVHFAGYRRDVPAVLAASDALLLASEREGLARSVLEGMAAGLPIIGTRTRGIADAVGSDAGWIVPKHDATALAAAIDAAAADPTERARRGEAGRRRVAERYALPRIISAYEELYREALA